MQKNKVLLVLAAVLALGIALNFVSAYSHTTFKLSDSISYNEDIVGENRGFSLTRYSDDISRLTPEGYYDWSYRPRVVYPDQSTYEVSDRLALEAFRTFSADSKDQSKIEIERERNKYSYSSFGGYYGSYYPPYSRSYYRWGF